MYVIIYYLESNERVMKVWEIWTLREVFLHPTMKHWTEHPTEVSNKNSCARSQMLWLLEICFLDNVIHAHWWDVKWMYYDNCRLLTVYFFLTQLELYWDN